MATPINMLASTKGTDFGIADAADCAAAQQSARKLALTIGFPGLATEEIALVVAELGTNLIKHAGRGTLSVCAIELGALKGIEIETFDAGPGMQSVEAAFADGYSTAGSLGYGMGTINRLMDEMDITSSADRGTQIVCRRWVKPDRAIAEPRAWEVGVFTRAKGGARENGDAFIVKQWNGHLLVGLIDGLGHGEHAQRAAVAAQQYVQSHYDLPLEKIFAGTSRACRGTRGVVMALAHFSSPTQLDWASVGNIEVRAWSEREKVPFSVKRGILGVEETRVHPQTFGWKPTWTLVLHTDGLRTHWNWSDFPGIEREPGRQAAARLMRELMAERDDATVIVVKEARS